jgi:hypothetical protein
MAILPLRGSLYRVFGEPAGVVADAVGESDLRLPAERLFGGRDVEAAVALVFTGILSALYPSWRAVRVPPADALAGR